MTAWSAVVLAAGLGTRMRSQLAKVLHPLGGRPMILHVLRSVAEVGIPDPVVVVGHQAERVMAAAGPARYVRQENPAGGTGQAVLLALEQLPAAGHTLVLYGDVPLVRPATLQALMSAHVQEGAAATLLTTRVEDPTGYGRVVRDGQGRFVRVVEEKDASPEEREIREINTGIYAFALEALRRHLASLTPDNRQGQYYLPDVLARLVAEGSPVATVAAEDPAEVLGVNDRLQLAEAEAVLRRRILLRWLQAGVTVVDPASTFIEDTVTLEEDVVILPFTFLVGNTHVARGARIGPMSRVISSRVGPGAVIEQSTVEESELLAGVRVGPFAHIRPGCRLAEGVRVGNFAELKAAQVGENTRVSHHSYLGDVTVGREVNIGAGTVVVNYDSRQKWHSRIEDGAFVGCNSNLVSPVVVGPRAYVAAGSTITDDVPGEALGVARAKQRNVEGWVRRKFGSREE